MTLFCDGSVVGKCEGNVAELNLKAGVSCSNPTLRRNWLC